jgi:hypothetical protein
MTEPKDRGLAIVASTSVNGIDFVEVTAPRTLVVHFLNAVALADPSVAAMITGGDSVPTVAVAKIDNATDWSNDAEGRPLLTLHTVSDGDFSEYLLTIAAPALDIVLNSTTFSFKATCPSDFDCAPPPHQCPPDDTDVPPIDYLAKDYQSFRQALLEFSALRYPQWVERSEADLGLVVAELISAVGDELSYFQDRVAAEGSLPTATQRRSLVSLARLVDYEPRPAVSAATIIQCNVGAPGAVKAGARISAVAPDGAVIPFEIGTGLADIADYPVSDVWNFAIAPYWFDDKDQCWPEGATDLWVGGHGFAFTAGQALLIQTDLPGESVRQIVHLTAPGHEAVDPIFLTGGLPTPVTHIVWGQGEALTRARDQTRTIIGGNLLPATQGQRFSESFATGMVPPSAPQAALAIARRGPNGSDDEPNYVFRFPLSQGPLGWLTESDSSVPPAPEILLRQLSPAAADWSFATTLLQSLGTGTDFTIDPVAWQVIARSGDGRPTHFDIAGDDGSAIRFGDNVFGASPAEQDLFLVSYRTGLGAAGNVAVDTITIVDPDTAGLIASARNPFAVTSGADAETAGHVRRMAPQAFRAVQYRAVRAEDYEMAAETLPWVQKACTNFRWTGSWITVFTAADPRGSERISVDEHVALVELLNRRRLAGYESYAPPPNYVSIDLRIEVCVLDGWLDGDVEAAVLDVLGAATRPDGSSGFFFADRFSFGKPLYRSRLEAAIQDAPGVAGVRSIKYRQRGVFAGFVDLPEAVTPAPTQILRVDNDPSWPERGTIRVIAEGGR